MTYNELSKKAQNKAQKDYLNGWLDTHENDRISLNDIHTILLDNNDLYDEKGNFIGENNNDN